MKGPDKQPLTGDGGVQKMVSPFFEHHPSRVTEVSQSIFLYFKQGE
jgi:hypothetical protein